MTVPPRISAKEKLATVELYFELQSTHAVAERLGITRNSVRKRLEALNINTRHNGGSAPAEQYNDMDYVKQVKADLRELIEHEKTHPVRRFNSDGVPPAVLLETLQLYLKVQTVTGVAAKMGVTPPTVSSRLASLGVVIFGPGRRQPGVSVADINDMKKIQATIRRLKAEIEPSA